MTFCEARVQVGFPDYLLVDMGIFGLAAWFKAMRERLGDTQKVAEFEKIEVPGDLVIELIKSTKGRFHHRGVTGSPVYFPGCRTPSASSSRSPAVICVEPRRRSP